MPRDGDVWSVGLDSDTEPEEQRGALVGDDPADLRRGDLSIGKAGGHVETSPGADEVTERNRCPESASAAPRDDHGCAHTVAVRAHDGDRGFGHAPGCTEPADRAASYPQLSVLPELTAGPGLGSEVGLMSTR